MERSSLGVVLVPTGSRSRNGVARLNAVTGIPDSLTANTNDVVYAIALQADGKILVGGKFTNIGGQSRNYIARLDPSNRRGGFL